MNESTGLKKEDLLRYKEQNPAKFQAKFGNVDLDAMAPGEILVREKQWHGAVVTPANAVRDLPVEEAKPENVVASPEDAKPSDSNESEDLSSEDSKEEAK